MTQDNPTPRNDVLFARKGDAAPAPAVGYVSLRALQGKPERRRGQARFDGLERRRSVLERWLGTPPPASPRPRPESDVPQAAATPPPTGAPASPLSTLIRRQPTVLELGAVSRSLAAAAADDRPGAPAPRSRHAPETGGAVGAGDRRVQFTVRLDAAAATWLKAHAELRHATYQDVLASAAQAYLERVAPGRRAATSGSDGGSLWRRLVAGGRESDSAVEPASPPRGDGAGSRG